LSFLSQLKEEDVEKIFWFPVPRKQFPDYYKVIKEPMDLTRIETNLSDKKYVTVSEYLHDICLLCANAMTYNESGSFVYEVAAEWKSRAETMFSPHSGYEILYGDEKSVTPMPPIRRLRERSADEVKSEQKQPESKEPAEEVKDKDGKHGKEKEKEKEKEVETEATPASAKVKSGRGKAKSAVAAAAADEDVRMVDADTGGTVLFPEPAADTTTHSEKKKRKDKSVALSDSASSAPVASSSSSSATAPVDKEKEKEKEKKPTEVKIERLQKIVLKLKKIDADAVFQHPVTDDLAPNYSKIIKEPVCVDDIEARLNSYLHPDKNSFKVVLPEFATPPHWDELTAAGRSYALIKSDIWRMICNAKLYNEEGSYVHELAVSLEKKLLPDIKVEVAPKADEVVVPKEKEKEKLKEVKKEKEKEKEKDAEKDVDKDDKALEKEKKKKQKEEKAASTKKASVSSVASLSSAATPGVPVTPSAPSATAAPSTPAPSADELSADVTLDAYEAADPLAPGSKPPQSIVPYSEQRREPSHLVAKRTYKKSKVTAGAGAAAAPTTPAATVPATIPDNTLYVPKEKLLLFNRRKEQLYHRPMALASVLQAVLAKWYAEDVHSLFKEPVDETECPDYRFYVDRVVSLRDMQQWLREGKYDSATGLEEFERDFEDLCQNAIAYNREGTLYHAEAARLLAGGRPLLQQIRERILKLKAPQKPLGEKNRSFTWPAPVAGCVFSVFDSGCRNYPYAASATPAPSQTEDVSRAAVASERRSEFASLVVPYLSKVSQHVDHVITHGQVGKPKVCAHDVISLVAADKGFLKHLDTDSLQQAAAALEHSLLRVERHSAAMSLFARHPAVAAQSEAKKCSAALVEMALLSKILCELTLRTEPQKVVPTGPIERDLALYGPYARGTGPLLRDDVIITDKLVRYVSKEEYEEMMVGARPVAMVDSSSSESSSSEEETNDD
jgi:hypothetical protein